MGIVLHSEAPLPRTLEDISSDFDALTEHDFDHDNPEAQGRDQLDALCKELREREDGSMIAPALFRTMERLDGADTGSPGSLVHTLESWHGKYEQHLVDSILRRPSRLAVWMINRILNVDPPDAAAWLLLLRSVENHPTASSAARGDAVHFLKLQAARSHG